MPAFAPLADNHPFAFRGEAVAPARELTAATARRVLAARNPTGKPNADVLREFIGVARDGDEVRRWTLDFPAEMTATEARLYLQPHSLLEKTGAPLATAGRHSALRNALARIERFLASPAGDPEPAFTWIEGDVLPDSSLVVWARDDDFSAALLASRAFALWSGAAHDLFVALRSFPFPWPPATALSSLSRTQEDLRFDLARAARQEDLAAIDAAASRAYGWDPDSADDALLAALHRWHDVRARLT